MLLTFLMVQAPLPTDWKVNSWQKQTLWSERVRLTSAEAIASYAGGPLAGVPAVARNAHGTGVAWYLTTRPIRPRWPHRGPYPR
ncbi:hypothetical protein GCM10010103_55360 [Streptomyces paradoxus]